MNKYDRIEEYVSRYVACPKTASKLGNNLRVSNEIGNRHPTLLRNLSTDKT